MDSAYDNDDDCCYSKFLLFMANTGVEYICKVLKLVWIECSLMSRDKYFNEIHDEYNCTINKSLL